MTHDFLNVDGERLMVGKRGLLYLDSQDVLLDSPRGYQLLAKRGWIPPGSLQKGEEMILKPSTWNLMELIRLLQIPGSRAEEELLLNRFFLTTPSKQVARPHLVALK